MIRDTNVQPAWWRSIRIFSSSNIPDALDACTAAVCDGLYMPALIDARLASTEGNPWIGTACDLPWATVNWTSRSLCATGRTKQGTPVVIYRHMPHYYTDPEKIRQVLEDKQIVNGAAPIPQAIFQQYVDEDGKTDSSGNRLMWVIDYAVLKASGSGPMSVYMAPMHPQMIPFIGGERRMRRYCEKHCEERGQTINIHYFDDLRDAPMGRLLGLGYYDYFSPGPFTRSGNLNDSGCVAGVPRAVASVNAEDAAVQDLDTILDVEIRVKVRV